ncbi:DUF2079 domain-containing protein [Actinomadura parmotrematis]|uniref:DUF2079 domain-containing protein n=1 Tax=Actinomadura parmotrematis TaxID=2864039 RepID=A0ABS7FPG5_9ACTN|nr:DUF2079 domain-containing protein [Actinomadura parmotrematis]MBW8482110.1 DUF2079 domain-containing protein [Actinomadura parmotrematis]
MTVEHHPPPVPAADRPDAAPAPRAWPPYALALGFAVLYGAVSVTRYLRYASMSWDLGIFTEVVRSYARFQVPVADLKGPGFRILGDHFSPVLALLGPVFRVFPSAVTLLVAQALLVGVSAVPVTRAARRLLGARPGLAIGLAYGASWGLQKAVDFDFHEICFAVPLIAFALEAVLAERWIPALLWAAPLVTVKEDLGVTVAAIALVVAVRARRAGTPTVAAAVGVGLFGAAASALTLLVLIPAVSGGYDYWSKMGGGGGAGLLDGWSQKVRTVLWVLLPTSGMLALGSPLLLVALPTLGWRLLSSDPNYWGTDWHYSAVLMPVVALALVDVLARARSTRLWEVLQHMPAAVLAASVALSTTLPFGTLTRAGTWIPDAEARAAARALATIPDGATVESDVRPAAHLAQRCTVYWIGDTPGVLPRYLVYFGPDLPGSAMLDYATRLHPGERYAVQAEEEGFWVLRRL